MAAVVCTKCKYCVFPYMPRRDKYACCAPAIKTIDFITGGITSLCIDHNEHGNCEHFKPRHFIIKAVIGV